MKNKEILDKVNIALEHIHVAMNDSDIPNFHWEQCDYAREQLMEIRKILKQNFKSISGGKLMYKQIIEDFMELSTTEKTKIVETGNFKKVSNDEFDIEKDNVHLRVNIHEKFGGIKIWNDHIRVKARTFLYNPPIIRLTIDYNNQDLESILNEILVFKSTMEKILEENLKIK